MLLFVHQKVADFVRLLYGAELVAYTAGSSERFWQRMWQPKTLLRALRMNQNCKIAEEELRRAIIVCGFITTCDIFHIRDSQTQFLLCSIAIFP